MAERQKSILGRKMKRPAAAPGDFIALGKQSKSGDSENKDLKRPSSPTHLARKKESNLSSTSAISSPLAKKAKISGPTFGQIGRAHDVSSAGYSSSYQQYDDIAIIVDPTELHKAVCAADDDMNDERSERLVCGAIKHLRTNRSKPDQIIYLTLMHLSKTKPNLFCTDIIIEAFCGLLKRELALTFKAKGNPLVSVLACNVLMNAFSDEDNWPDNFVKVFVEDSLGERVWVDRDDCKGFVENIQTAFGTKKSPKHLLMGIAELPKENPGSPARTVDEDQDNEKGDADKMFGQFPVQVTQRYVSQQESVETYIMETIKDILNRRQSMDSSSRNLIRLMSSTCGYSEVRSMAAQRMDMWLQNPKLTRVSQDLLLSICVNCDKHDQSDLEVIANLAKMRMKTKPLITHFLTCMKELLSQHSENLRMILKHTIYNELSNSRNPNNMPLLGVMFSHSPDRSAKILAEIFQELLANKDDYLRALRVLLREIVRCTKLDMNFSTLCLGLMQERTEQKFTEMDSASKERYIASVADLISMAILLSVSLQVREASSAVLQGDHKNLKLVHVFKKQVSVIERDAVWWLHTVVPKILELQVDVYLHCLKKVLFLETADQYYNKDNWPAESERGLMLRLASEGPVLEDTLMRLLVIGLLRELPLTAPAAMELVEQLACRAATLYYDLGLMDVLQMERLEFFDALLNLCVYKHPENIVLPQGYAPPNLAITGLFWKAWLILLIVTAYNPSVFGETAWEKYPTLQILMEMVMTNSYVFPPPTMATTEKNVEEFRSRERQIRQQEIQMIIQFETHLASNTITESTSHLIGQLNMNEPTGPARYPPPEVLEQLKSLNSSLKLGHMLCRSRSPDFLLQVINRQGTSQSMPWLAELVESNEGSLDVLPVQCLCEFLLHEPDSTPESDLEDLFSTETSKRSQKATKHQQLLSRLQELVHGEASDLKAVKEVLDYFLQRLASTQASKRQQAVKGLSLVVSSQDREEMEIDGKNSPRDDWLLNQIPSLLHFEELRQPLCLAFRKACQVETDPQRLRAYILFISQHSVDSILDLQTWNELALDVAQLIVERASIMNFILPRTSVKPVDRTDEQIETVAALQKIFLTYMSLARRDGKETISWLNTQDQILVEWESGQSATVHILVVHAMLVLLTFGKPSGREGSEVNKDYQRLMEMWIDKGKMPSAYLLDTTEEALLLPDWLKLKMLRSQNPLLVDTALQEVETTQLILFVQSFGMPVSTMSRLLQALDRQSTSDPTSISEAAMDKNYMANLLRIQHLRGVKGGQIFYRLITDGKELTVNKEKSSCEEVHMEEEWDVKSAGDVIIPSSVDKLARILDTIFSENKGKESKVIKLFQSLLQTIMTDKVKTAAIVKALDNLLSSSKKETFTQKVFTATTKSCPIFKIIISKQPDLHRDLLPVMQKLNTLGQGYKSMLSAIVTQFMTSQGREQQTKQGAVKSLIDKCTHAGRVDVPAFCQGLDKLKDTESVEIVVQRTMKKLMSEGKAIDGSQIAVAVLSSDNCSGKMPRSFAKLFIDWLALLDPEIVNVNPEVHEKLIFARELVAVESSGKDKTDVDKELKGIPSQAHLLALLTHQTNWSTLTKSLSRVLAPGKATQLNPTAVLDFVWAAQHIPKLWQGREKKTETEKKENMLGLSSSHLLTLVDMVLEEAALAVQSSKGKEKDQDVNLSERVIKSRLELLLSCICEDMEKVADVVGHLHKLCRDDVQEKSGCVVELSSCLYLQFPYIKSWIDDQSPLLAQVMSSATVSSQMDVVSHRLISSLGLAKFGHRSQNRMHDASIACRKMAAHHPAIFLRQLPLLSAILSGQTEFTIGELRHTNRLLLFYHVLGLVELLQPQVFDPHHHGFLDILDSFFSLIQIHGKEQKSLGSLIHKFTIILLNFLSHQPKTAKSYLKNKVELLGNLSQEYPDGELKSLLTSLTLPGQSEDQSESSTDQGAPLLTGNTNYTAAQLAPFKKRFTKSSSDDLLQALQDLDRTSQSKVEILSYFESQLQNLVMSANDQCRGTAFTLVMRYLRHNPRHAHHFVSTFLDCLGCANPDIVVSALKNLPEFTALCQEEARVILQKAFTVGVKSSIDSSSYISEALQMLNLHSATIQ